MSLSVPSIGCIVNRLQIRLLDMVNVNKGKDLHNDQVPFEQEHGYKTKQNTKTLYLRLNVNKIIKWSRDLH